MKLLLVIVSIIAVFTVDCHNFSDGYEDQHLPGKPEGHNSLAEDLKPNDTEGDSDLKETSQPVAQGTQDIDSSDIDQQERKEEQEPNIRKLRCKARNACVVMGGFCVTNATLCGGRLVPEGCKGTNCQCCVPGTLETKISDLEQDLKSMKDNLTDDNSRLSIEFQSRMDNLTDDNSRLRTELQSRMDNLNDANTRLNMEFQTRMDNLTDIIYNMGSKLDSIMRRCPVGFFHTSGSSQCYKFYNDTTRSWTEAKEKCQTEGLVLAEPANPISLRKYLVETYGNRTGAYGYLGARGTGSYFRWEQNGRQISNSDSMWYTGHPTNRVSSTYCLLMLVERNTYLVSYPNQPYYAQTCNSNHFTVCEYVMA